MSAKAVQDAVQVLALVMIFIIVLGVAYFFGRQFEALGLPWPSVLDTLLSILVGFVELIMTLYDIRGLVVPIAIFITITIIILIALGGVFRGTGR
ncbi:MAG: hypothetical protein LM558_02315 [Thermosphaera sp.]|nr:hypothetical protein [Thermosphaera sp.]